MLQAFLQNFANFITGQLLAAASGDVGRIRHGAEVGVGGDAKLCKAGRQTDFLNKRGQRVDTGSRGLLVAALGSNAPDVLRPAGEPRRAGFVDVAVQDRVDDRQPRAVVAVGVSAELMLDLMRLKIRDLADLQHAVLCHGGRPR